MRRNFSALATPCSVIATVFCFSSISKSKSATNDFFERGSIPSGVLPTVNCGARRANFTYRSAACSGAPEMISGVRASSIRMLSTSSTIANGCPRWTFSEMLGGHVVAQVVEAELRVRAVDDVTGIGGVLLLRRLHVFEHADAHTERVIDRAHPFCVAPGKVVVDRHDVHALALGLGPLGRLDPLAHRQRVQHDGQRRRQGLALAGLHLCDLPVVQRHRADQLHVEMAHPHRALARLAHDREALRQQRVERLAVGRALAQHVHPLAQLGVRVVFELGLERVDQRHALLVFLELLRLADVQRAIEQGGHGPRIASVGAPATRRPAGRSPGSIGLSLSSLRRARSRRREAPAPLRAPSERQPGKLAVRTSAPRPRRPSAGWRRPRAPRAGGGVCRGGA